jgi:hypothetical protein
MAHRYNVFILEHQIARFSIEVETDEDVRAAILEARKHHEHSGTRWSAHAEAEIDDAEIFARRSIGPSLTVDHAILPLRVLERLGGRTHRLIELKGEGFACDWRGYHAVLAVKAVARASPALASARRTRGLDACAAA